MIQKYKALFLYTEIAGYFISACEKLAEKMEVHVIHWPIASEAPFDFDKYNADGLFFYKKKEYANQKLENLVDKINPSIIFCSGWLDKEYLKIAAKYNGKIPTVISMDNHWTGSLKQRLATVFAKYTLLRRFSHIWLPGEAQKQYALKLGFRENQIHVGFYTADVDQMELVYQLKQDEKDIKRPKRFLFLGRYVEHKGIFDLWSAYQDYVNEGGQWELWCVGTGDEWENRIEGKGIKHFGFKQPDEVNEIVRNCDAYILPSHFEPWGVSVHEMAVAGLPLILSENIGSASVFLVEGENGLTFTSGNRKLLQDCMVTVSNKHNEELMEMGKKSHSLGQSITPEKWVDTVLKLIQE